VNPLAETPDGKLLAADAKLGFDDNASFRQKEVFAMKDESQIDSRCVPSVWLCSLMPQIIEAEKQGGLVIPEHTTLSFISRLVLLLCVYGVAMHAGACSDVPR
jgi:hypothetical protein